MDDFYRHHTVIVTIDSGTTGNVMRQATAEKLGSTITKWSQSAHKADGSSPMIIVGETTLTLTRDNNTSTLSDLVVKKSWQAHPSWRPTTSPFALSNTSSPYLTAPPSSTGRQANPSTDTEPRIDSLTSKHTCDSDVWPQPSIIASIAGKMRIANMTNTVRILKQNGHFCQIREVFVSGVAKNTPSYTLTNHNAFDVNVRSRNIDLAQIKHSGAIQVDPDEMLSSNESSAFHTIIEEYNDVFDRNYRDYNSHVGPFETVVNMGPVQPPQRKGRIPTPANMLSVIAVLVSSVDYGILW